MSRVTVTFTSVPNCEGYGQVGWMDGHAVFIKDQRLNDFDQSISKSLSDHSLIALAG
jgi:hypothetical protein